MKKKKNKRRGNGASVFQKESYRLMELTDLTDWPTDSTDRPKKTSDPSRHSFRISIASRMKKRIKKSSLHTHLYTHIPSTFQFVFLPSRKNFYYCIYRERKREREHVGSIRAVMKKSGVKALRLAQSVVSLFDFVGAA